MIYTLLQYGGQMPGGPMPGGPMPGGPTPGMPGMPGMPPQGMPGGPMGGPMPGPMGGPMGGAPPQGGYGSYGGYPGAYGAAAPAANDPMWGYFTAIAGQVSLTKQNWALVNQDEASDTRPSTPSPVYTQKKSHMDFFF